MMESIPPVISSVTDQKTRYSPPWVDLSIIGIAGSSGSGKTSVAMEIVKSLNLPWVVILVMVLYISRHDHRLYCLTFDVVGLIL
jgi:uridine kinase